MKFTLLELTQEILSSMDSDEVNSISDTAEAQQVAKLVRTTYFNIISRLHPPEHVELFQLDASTDATLPVTMTIPDRAKNVEWIKYLLEDSINGDMYQYVNIVSIEQFLDMVNAFNTNDSNVASYVFTDNGNTFTFLYKNDRQPMYCTVLSDNQVLFDSYDSSIDTTLQSSKTLCKGEIIPTFTMSDEFVPDLDEVSFPLLLNEAKALAFSELKQTINQKAEQESRRQWISSQKTKYFNKPSHFDQLPNFGRMAPMTGIIR